MSSWCIEYWKSKQKTEGSHAQFKHISYVKPDPKDISKRFFPNYTTAMDFAKSMHDQGYLTKVF